MRKQIFALAIFAVLLVAAGAVVSMAQESSTSKPTVPSGEINVFQTAGPFCLDLDGYVDYFKFYITPVGPNEWTLVGQNIGDPPSPIDGSIYYEGGMFYIGIETFPVLDPSIWAGARVRGELSPTTGAGWVCYDNPMWGFYGETTWQLVPCSAPVVTSGKSIQQG